MLITSEVLSNNTLSNQSWWRALFTLALNLPFLPPNFKMFWDKISLADWKWGMLRMSGKVFKGRHRLPRKRTGMLSLTCWFMKRCKCCFESPERWSDWTRPEKNHHVTTGRGDVIGGTRTAHFSFAITTDVLPIDNFYIICITSSWDALHLKGVKAEFHKVPFWYSYEPITAGVGEIPFSSLWALKSSIVTR